MCGPDVLSLGEITADFLSFLFCDRGKIMKQVDSKMEGIERLNHGGQVGWTAQGEIPDQKIRTFWLAH